MRFKKVLILAALFALVIGLIAQPVQTGKSDDGSAQIHLRTATIDTKTGAVQASTLPSGTTIQQFIQSQPDWTQEESAESSDLKQYLVVVKEASEDAVFMIESVLSGIGGVLFYVPDNSYLVLTSPDQADRLSASGAVTLVIDYQPQFRIAPEAFEPQVKGDQVSTEEDTDYVPPGVKKFFITLATLSDGSDPAHASRLASDWASTLASRGIAAKFEVGSGRRLQLDTTDSDSAAAVAYVAQQPDVHWVEPYDPIELHNQFTAPVLQGTDLVTNSIWNRGIHGEGEVIGCADTGVDYDHCFFYDSASSNPTATYSSKHRKFVGYNPMKNYGDYAAGHGTHVAGILAGEAVSSNAAAQSYAQKFNGIAYKAKLAFIDVGDTGGSLFLPSDLTSGLFPWSYNSGARVHSNSWGSTANTYTSRAADVDTFMWRNKDFLIVQSNGNAGPSAGTVSSPATAKNVIAVGATNASPAGWKFYCCSLGGYACCTNTAVDCDSGCNSVPKGSGTNQETLASFSSRGPLSDNRIAPTVTAPGSRIFSAYSDGSLTSYQCGTSVGVTIISKAGTSMAAPAVAASAALVRQYFREGWYPSGVKGANPTLLPTSALLKAMIINSAMDMASYGATPNSNEGYGRVNLGSALKFQDSNFNLFVSQSDTVSTGASRDICVYSLGGTRPLKITLVWTDPPGSPSASKALINNLDLTVVDAKSKSYIGNGALDSVNPQEQVVITAPPLGVTKITVKGTLVPQGPQPYALVVTGMFDAMDSCTAPTPGGGGSTTAACCLSPHLRRFCSC